MDLAYMAALPQEEFTETSSKSIRTNAAKFCFIAIFRN